MQRILITGGAGFIGSNFVRMMLGKYPDIAITVYDKLTYAGRLENLQDIAINYPDRYHFIQGDICDAAAVEQAIAGRQIDAFIQTDIYGTYVLLEAARKAGNLRYHQISTDEVYGHVEGSHRSLETDNVAPRSPYAASKAGADHLVNAYFITYGLPITISRGANNVGPYQYPEKVVPLFVTTALNDMPLPVYGDGKQRRDYQYVLDHCQAVDLVLRKGALGETYNIGSGTEITNLQMVEILLDELHKPRSLIQHVEDRLGHDRRYCLDVHKIMALGWEPEYSHEEALRATARWYMHNQWWWEPIRSGEFRDYYQRVYGNRKRIA